MTRSYARTAVAATLAASLLLTSLPSSSQLPTLGDTSEMTSSAERKMGEKIARELYRDPDYIDDAVVSEYVQGIWQPLLHAARARGELSAELDERFAWQVLLGKDRTINAFALPGGWLGLHMGLISVTSNRDELASVLAHELSHVTQRHISRLITKEARNTPLMIAAMILGALAAGKNANAGSAVIVGSQAAAIQNQLNFSREMEREADRIGYGVMTQAGFDPQGFVTMFDKLMVQARLNDNGEFPYLRTHPMTTERIADMQSRQQLVTRAPSIAPSLEHAMMAARARVLSNSSVDGLRGYLMEADSAPAGLASARRAALLYAAALASSKLRDNAAATRYITQLRQAVQGDASGVRQARLLAGELALVARDAQRAMSLADSQGIGRADLLLWSQAGIQTGRAAEVAQRLQTWVALNPRDATAWQTLAAAWTAQRQPLRAIRAEAEAQVAWLDYAAAMDRFRAAQDLVRKSAGGVDHIEASIIDTRARQVQSLLREQALER